MSGQCPAHSLPCLRVAMRAKPAALPSGEGLGDRGLAGRSGNGGEEATDGLLR